MSSKPPSATWMTLPPEAQRDLLGALATLVHKQLRAGVHGDEVRDERTIAGAAPVPHAQVGADQHRRAGAG